jgi:hypothetical protein
MGDTRRKRVRWKRAGPGENNPHGPRPGQGGIYAELLENYLQMPYAVLDTSTHRDITPRKFDIIVYVCRMTFGYPRGKRRHRWLTKYRRQEWSDVLNLSPNKLTDLKRELVRDGYLVEIDNWIGLHPGLWTIDHGYEFDKIVPGSHLFITPGGLITGLDNKDQPQERETELPEVKNKLAHTMAKDLLLPLMSRELSERERKVLTRVADKIIDWHKDPPYTKGGAWHTQWRVNARPLFEKYAEWVKEQEWLSEIHPGTLQVNSKVWNDFVDSNLLGYGYLIDETQDPFDNY